MDDAIVGKPRQRKRHWVRSILVGLVVWFGVWIIVHTIQQRSLNATGFLQTSLKQNSGQSLKISDAMDLWAHEPSLVGTGHAPGTLTIHQTAPSAWRVEWTYHNQRFVFIDDKGAGEVYAGNANAKRFIGAVVDNSL